ncbi:hypothetical protein CEP53_006847 [Fusarium sp. AF-6]|nr:hypothetical protein CEP53_006847 [Fusarium sp. AF-6]
MTVLLLLQLSNGISAESKGGAVVLPFVSLLCGSLLSIRLSHWVGCSLIGLNTEPEPNPKGPANADTSKEPNLEHESA